MDFINTSDEKIHLIIGVTGSVAAIKIPLLIEELRSSEAMFRIALICTKNCKNFFNPNELKGSDIRVYYDEEEWENWKVLFDPVLHIELRKWAHLMVIAPLDANTLSKISHGICDNLLTCVARAWDLKKPFLFCPAMNTFMWEHPVTHEAVDKLISWGYIQVPVVSKKLACGDFGLGGMAEVSTIMNHIRKNIVKL